MTLKDFDSMKLTDERASDLLEQKLEIQREMWQDKEEPIPLHSLELKDINRCMPIRDNDYWNLHQDLMQFTEIGQHLSENAMTIMKRDSNWPETAHGYACMVQYFLSLWNETAGFIRGADVVDAVRRAWQWSNPDAVARFRHMRPPPASDWQGVCDLISIDTEFETLGKAGNSSKEELQSFGIDGGVPEVVSNLFKQADYTPMIRRNIVETIARSYGVEWHERPSLEGDYTESEWFEYCRIDNQREARLKELKTVKDTEKVINEIKAKARLK